MARQDARIEDQTLVHLRARFHTICRRLPLKRRRLVWGEVVYRCDTGPVETDGPFKGVGAGGCGWTRRVQLGVGVGRPVDGCAPIPPPPTGGSCERCGGVLSLVKGHGWINDHEREHEPASDLALVLVPSKKIAGRMVHEGELVAQMIEPSEFRPDDSTA